MLNNLLQMHLKLFQKELKQPVQIDNKIDNKIADKITQKSQEPHYRIIQERLQMKHKLWNLIKKYEKIDT